MAYNPTIWVNDTVPDIDADNMNKIEQGLATADANATSAKTEVEGIRTGADGTEYESAGQAVRDQIGNINTLLTETIEIIEVDNHLEFVEANVKSVPASVSASYDDTNKTATFTQVSVANHLIEFYLTGTFVSGEEYKISFNATGGMLSNPNIRYKTLENVDKAVSVNFTKDNLNNYSAEFEIPSDYGSNLFLRINTKYSSGPWVLSKGYCVLSDAQTEYIVKLSSLKDIEEDNLSDELKGKINKFEKIYDDDNKFDASTAGTSNQYINPATGEPKATGSPMRVTDYISVTPGEYLYFYKIIKGYFAWYDSNKTYIDGSEYSEGVESWNKQVPDNAVFGRFTLYASNLQTAWINSINKQPTNQGVYKLKSDVDIKAVDNPCNYDGKDFTIFNKCLCVGDSLTQGVCNYTEGGQSIANVAFPNYAYPKFLQKISGVEVTNKGSAGKTSAQWYAAFQNEAMAGYDVAIIQLGVNDALYNGGWTSESETAFTNIINKLKNENNNIVIFVSTIMPAISYTGTAIDDVSNGIRELVQSLQDENVILLDMAIYGHTGETLAYNAGHLTAYGYLRLALDYYAYIGWYINNNKYDFRFVQFIGTNHVY